MRRYGDRDFVQTAEGYFFCVIGPTHPEYMFHSSAWSVTIPAVPFNGTSTHFGPEKKLSQLIATERVNDLQSKVVDLANLISEESGVLLENFGVTGSVLLDIHRDFSDIDLIVYGMTNNLQVKEAVVQKLNEEKSPMQPLSARKAEEWS